jgi:hypothetical protein
MHKRRLRIINRYYQDVVRTAGKKGSLYVGNARITVASGMPVGSASPLRRPQDRALRTLLADAKQAVGASHTLEHSSDM